MGAPVFLLSCVKSERRAALPADMYTSPLFQKMMAYAESLTPKELFILSAKYGLLNPDDLIEPYELTLKRVKTGERQAWADFASPRSRGLIARSKKLCQENAGFVATAPVTARWTRPIRAHARSPGTYLLARCGRQ